jgi:hypothetical protein
VRRRLRGALEAKVSEVSNLVAELRDALTQPGDAHRRRPQVDARDASAEAARRADDADAAAVSGSASRLCLGLFFEKSAHENSTSFSMTSTRRARER